MDLKFETEATFVNEDHSWLASRLGFDTARPATLDLSLFTEGTHFPNGFIPSGMSLGRVTAAGANQNMYGPYGGNTNEVQTITRTATGGDNAITWDGEATAPAATPIVAATTAAQVQTALETMPNIDAGDVVVSGPAGGPFVITLSGRYAGLNVPPIEIDDTNATGGTVLIAQTTAGGSAIVDGREVGRGLLLASTPVRATNKTGKIVGAMLWQGIVRQSRLPASNGVDAAFRAAVNTIRWEA